MTIRLYSNFRHGRSRGDLMEIEFFRQHARRVRDLAINADPFTKKRLLALADKYDAKVGEPSKAARMIEWPVPLPRRRSASTDPQSGEA